MLEGWGGDPRLPLMSPFPLPQFPREDAQHLLGTAAGVTVGALVAQRGWGPRSGWVSWGVRGGGGAGGGEPISSSFVFLISPFKKRK